MTPAFFVLLTFFASVPGKHVEIVRECPTWTCVDQTTAMATKYGLFRYRVFGQKPEAVVMGDTPLVPPLLDYWLQ